MKSVILHSNRRSKIRYGHPWIFRSQIDQVDDSLQDGDIVEVYSSKNNFIGIGYFNSLSEITVRLLTLEKESIDSRFFEKRMRQAYQFRQTFVEQTNAYRMVFSEADQLPGLIIDNYNGVFVVQFLTLGIEKQKDLILNALKKIEVPKAIYLRNDFTGRKLEGLVCEKGFVGSPSETKIEITENNIHYLVDIEKGHKTGFYLDQRENRRIFSKLVKGKKVLDCFSSSGSFALIAAKKTEGKVLGLEASEEMIQQAQENARRNQLDRFCSFKNVNVFDELKALDQKGEKFDVVVLDPPSFTKGKKGIESAYHGYKEINLRAMKILNPGGLLVTASCSYHMTLPLFQQMLLDAAQDARKTVRLLHAGQQALDHPVELTIPETHYLKCFFLEVGS